MRIFCVPARYRDELEAAVKRCVDQVQLDIYRREIGEKPLVPDFAIDTTKTGDVFAVVGMTRDSLVAGIEVLRDGRRKAKAATSRKVAG